jgi:hypothetical protein
MTESDSCITEEPPTGNKMRSQMICKVWCIPVHHYGETLMP